MSSMNIRDSFVISFVACLMCLVPLAALAADGQLVSGTVRSGALDGNLLGDTADRGVIVYLPPSYQSAPAKRYPVVYLLHGNNRRNTVWTEGELQGLNVKTEMDSMISAGTIREMILVMPDVSNRYLGSHYANSVLTGRWADFISQDLVSYIDATYRTVRGPSGRGLAGHSMGGRGTFYLAMKYPGIYSAIYALSSGRMAFEQFEPFDQATWRQVLALKDTGNIDRKFFSPIGFAAAFSPNPNRPPLQVNFPFELVGDEPKRVESVWQQWLAHDPVALLSSHQAALRQLRAIQFDCGLSDQIAGLLEANRLFAQALTKAGIPHRFEEYDGNHSNRIRERVVMKVLPFFSTALAFE
jgi:enterochelin esterase-like enzyme